jgi:fibronectin-binding autotransporter adhesin
MTQHQLFDSGNQAGQPQPRHRCSHQSEAGHRLALSGNWSITPQAQLAWSQIRFDAFTDQYGANVARDNGDSLVARLGVSLDHETKWSAGNGKANRSHVYGIANLYYDFLRGTSARVADMNVTSKTRRCGPVLAWVHH